MSPGYKRQYIIYILRLHFKRLVASNMSPLEELIDEKLREGRNLKNVAYLRFRNSRYIECDF